MFVNTYRARADVDPSEKSIEMGLSTRCISGNDTCFTRTAFVIPTHWTSKRTSASRIMSSKMHATLSIHGQISGILTVMKQALSKSSQYHVGHWIMSGTRGPRWYLLDTIYWWIRFALQSKGVQHRLSSLHRQEAIVNGWVCRSLQCRAKVSIS